MEARPRPKPRGRGRGQSFEAEAKILASSHFGLEDLTSLLIKFLYCSFYHAFAPISAYYLSVVMAWLSGSVLISINVVTLRRARLILGWVTGSG